MLSFLNKSKSWTILKQDGSVALTFNSFLSMSAKTDNPTVQAPVEQGGYIMYNKIQTPLEINVQLAFTTQNDGEIDKAINDLLALSSSTDLVNIVTPDFEYKGFNLESLQWQRKTDQGAYVLIADLGFVEVKQVKVQYGNARVARRRQRGQQQAKEESFISIAKGWF